MVTKNTLTQQDKIKWSTLLDHAIVDLLHIPIDLLLCSEDELVKKQVLPGHIFRTAVREGVVL